MSSTKYQTDYEIDKLTLVTPTASSPVNMKPYMLEFSLFEDIFANSISGHLLISDALGLVPEFRLNGTEFINVVFRKNSQDTQGNIARTFRIYSISDRYVNPGNNYENYKLNFCSEELLVSEKYRISKSYKSKTISQIVQDVVNRYLKLGDKKATIEPTTGTYDFVLPNKKIFETINWLSTYALPSKNTGADMLFFENVDGFWFKSLQSLYTQNPYVTYYYNPKNVSPDMQYKYTNIVNLDILDSFDMLRASSSGTFANRLVSIDPITRTYTTTDFNYDEYYKKSTKLNKSSVTNNYTDRIGKMVFDSPPNDLQAGQLKVCVTNSNQRLNSYIKNKPEAVKSDMFVEKALPNRKAQLLLANYSRIKITVPGNAKLSVGMTLNVVVPRMAADTYTKVSNPVQRDNDPQLSGKYLITAVRHIIDPKSYFTVLELSKDSFEKPVPGVTSTWKQLADGIQIT